MATDTRPGFRLPWAGASESDGTAEANGTGESSDSSETERQTATGDAPAAQEAMEHEMIEHADTAEAAAPTDAHATPGGPDLPPARRATKFMADLSRAMQAAAENARADLMARFEAEAKGVVEEVRASATDEAANLRRKADDDVATIREWSKAEIARIRDATDARIAARKTGLDGEMEQHAATVEARVERVTTVVAAFEAQMQVFFERINAEEDPTRIATMAETMPEPPSLADVAATIAAAPAPIAAPAARVAEPPVPASGDDPSAEIDFAAAEAEAASFSTDLEDDVELPAAEAAPIDDEPVADAALAIDDAPAAELGSRRVVVSGLVSVANIANFKRSLSRTPGIATIGVASGPDGDFVFTVGHTLGTALSASILSLSGFDISITGETDGAINVAAQDRDATD